MVKTDGGGSVEIKVNADGGILIRHSQINPETWAELQDYKQKESGVDELIPKQGGYVVVGEREFRLNQREMDMIKEAVRQFDGMKLIVGQKYISATGNTTRVIESIDGDNVCWRDEYGSGRCTKGTFRKWAGPIHPESEQPPSTLPSAVSTIDRRATNELLEVVLNIQNYLATWGRMLDEMAVRRGAVLTRSQRETYPIIVKQISDLESQLEQLRHGLER
jgi:hypothetical protein